MARRRVEARVRMRLETSASRLYPKGYCQPALAAVFREELLREWTERELEAWPCSRREGRDLARMKQSKLTYLMKLM